MFNKTSSFFRKVTFRHGNHGDLHGRERCIRAIAGHRLPVIRCFSYDNTGVTSLNSTSGAFDVDADPLDLTFNVGDAPSFVVDPRSVKIRIHRRRPRMHRNRRHGQPQQRGRHRGDR